MKKCMEYEVVGSRPRGRPKRTWLEVVQRDCQVCGLSKDDAVVRGRWRKMIRMVDEQELPAHLGRPGQSAVKWSCVCVLMTSKLRILGRNLFADDEYCELTPVIHSFTIPSMS